MDYQALKKSTDLTKNDPIKVIKLIPSLLSTEIDAYTTILSEMTEEQRVYDYEYSKMLSFYATEAEFDINKMFKVKDDRELYMIQNTKAVKDSKMILDDRKTKLKILEQNMNYLKVLQGNIRILLDFEQFRAGK